MLHNGWRAGEQGVTPVVATLLLIGLTIAAVSVVAVTVGQMQPSGRAPQVELGNIRAELIQGDADNLVTRVSFVHKGGEPLKANELRVTIHGVNNLGDEGSTSISTTSDASIKFGDDTACVLANWQDFSTPRGEPYYPSGTEVEIFIVHDPSGTLLANVSTTVGGRVFPVYGDSGIPFGSEVWTWSDGGSGSFNGDYTGETPPEGSKCFETKTNAGSWAGWGVFLVYPSHHTVDLSSYSSLKFWVKTPADLKVEIEAPEGTTQTKWISNYGWDGTNTWQEITIPAGDFTNLDQVYCPFKVTIPTSGTFYADYVRWV